MALSERSGDDVRELELLEVIGEDPSVRQVDLATRLDVAVGTVNWLLKRLAAKGYIRMKRIGRWQWRYLLTPSGIARKTKLAREYVHLSMNLYRTTRASAQRLLRRVRAAECKAVRLDGSPENDLLDVCRLTCLEEGIEVAKERDGNRLESLPILRVVNRELELQWPGAGETDA